MSISGFAAEKADSGDQLFAVFKTTSDSFLYPVGFSAWGSSASINVTSTAAPMPAQLFGNGFSSGTPLFVTTDSGNPPTFAIGALSTASKIQVEPVNNSANPMFVGNNSAHPMIVRGLTSSVVSVQIASGGADTTVTVTVNDSGSPYFFTTDSGNPPVVEISNAPDTTVTIAALSTASKIQVEPVNDSANPMFAVNNSGHPFFVRGLTSSAVTVGGTVAVSNIADNDTVVTVTNSPDSTVTISNDSAGTVGVTQNAFSGGGLQSVTFQTSSLAFTVTSSAARLYGYHVGNPDSAAAAWLKFYQDDSAGVTLGTSSAIMDLFIPFGGGAIVAPTGPGIAFSSGISIAAAGGGGSTNHAAPLTVLTVTVWFAD